MSDSYNILPRIYECERELTTTISEKLQGSITSGGVIDFRGHKILVIDFRKIPLDFFEPGYLFD